jgi:hypothetical protein
MPLSELDSLNLGRRDRRGKTLRANAQASFAAFIANPRRKGPGNKMAFADIKDQIEIANSGPISRILKLMVAHSEGVLLICPLLSANDRAGY